MDYKNEYKPHDYTDRQLEKDDYCKRCTLNSEGYCDELDEWLCDECMVLAFADQIQKHIGSHTDDVEVIERVFEQVIPRTNGEEMFISFDYDLNGESFCMEVPK